MTPIANLVCRKFEGRGRGGGRSVGVRKQQMPFSSGHLSFSGGKRVRMFEGVGCVVQTRLLSDCRSIALEAW